jgi:hypothetical protein
MKATRVNKNYPKPAFRKFEDLFKDKNDIPYCLGVLRTAVPAVINDSDEYLLKSKKGPVVAWKSALIYNGYIHRVNDQIAANLLNLKFKNLNIKDGSFRSNQSRVFEEYQMQFALSLNPKLVDGENSRTGIIYQ